MCRSRGMAVWGQYGKVAPSEPGSSPRNSTTGRHSNLGLLAFIHVGKWISAVQAIQFMVFCYGSHNRLRHTTLKLLQLLPQNFIFVFNSWNSVSTKGPKKLACLLYFSCKYQADYNSSSKKPSFPFPVEQWQLNYLLHQFFWILLPVHFSLWFPFKIALLPTTKPSH